MSRTSGDDFLVFEGAHVMSILDEYLDSEPLEDNASYEALYRPLLIQYEDADRLRRLLRAAFNVHSVAERSDR